MVKQDKQFEISGLQNYADVFSATLDGSLTVANNVVIDQKNLVSPRRGYKALPIEDIAGVDTPIADAESLFSIDGKIHYQTSTGDMFYYDEDKLYWDKYVAPISKPANATRTRIAESNNNTYLTSNHGVQKITSVGSPISNAGAPQALSATATIAIGNTIPTATSVAYRVLWGIKDENNNLILGAPSQRTLVTNSLDPASFADVSLLFRIPVGITTEWFYQVYRTKGVAAGITPSDEMFLVKEFNPTPAELLSSTVSFVDKQPQDFLSVPLYTNATQEGLVNSNYEPPQSTDLALFQGHLFYANTARRTEIIIQLLGTGVNALQDGDSITIDGQTYTGRTAGNITTPTTEFEVFVSASPTADSEDTAKSLITLINNNPVSRVVAYYWSDVGLGTFELAGRIRLVEKDFNDAPDFAVYASAAGGNNAPSESWTPNLTVSENVTAEAEVKANRIYYSKLQEPEAVPLPNYFDVGAANDSILRIIPLRTSILIFTESGIYRLSGTTQSSFQVNLLDNTARLISEDSAVSFNNAVYGLFDQGVCQVSEAVQVLSRPIEGDLLRTLGATGDNLNKLSYGIAYESERKYILYTPVTVGDTESSSRAFVYNTVTRSWTTWTLERKHGIIHKDSDKLIMLSSSGISIERKDFNELDVAEEQIPTTTNIVTGPDLQINGAALANSKIGYIYSESESKFSKILAIDVGASVITLQDDLDWSPSLLTRDNISYTIGDLSIPVALGYEDIRPGAIITGPGIATNTKVVRVDIGVIHINKAVVSTQSSVTLTINQTYDILPYIEVLVEWNPFYMGDPGTLKQFSEATLMTTSAMENVTVGFKGVTSGSFEDIGFSENVVGAWGLFEWGNNVWGGDLQVLRYRTYIPREKQRDSALYARVKVNSIYNLFELSGFSITYREIGPRTRR